MNVLRDIGRWFWNLLPGNPILVRVVAAASKRPQHFWARLSYLAALFAVLLVMGSNIFSTQAASLAELAKKSSQTFMAVSMVQLFLMSFIAPVFTAGAITQEKDANTFHILLTTPLTNAQIVIGMLFSRLFFVLAMLIAGVPIFCITMLYGGVTAREVFESLALAAATGLVTGALAILIAVARVGTRKTIFAFFLGVASYLVSLMVLGLSPYGRLPEAPTGPGGTLQMSWLAPVHPILALLVVTGQTPPPAPEAVHHYGWPWRWMLAYPQYAYLWITSLVSAAFVLLAIVLVRRGTKEGELTVAQRARALVRGDAPGDERRHKPRHVWNNPIAWREAVTRGSTAGRSAMRWLFIGSGFALGLLLLVAHEQGWFGLNPQRPALTRAWLMSIVWIELAVILIVVTNTAASTLTREKETRTLDLLLVTPLTSRYILAGMLRGLVSFVVPMIAAPTFMLALFAFADLLHPQREVLTPEAVVLVPLLMVAYASVAAMVGLQFSLVSRKTVKAVMTATAVVAGAATLLTGCGLVTLSSGAGPVAAALAPISPFVVIGSLIDTNLLFRDALNPPPASALEQARYVRDVAALLGALGWGIITFSLYGTLVRNFDMTIRRQSA